MGTRTVLLSALLQALALTAAAAQQPAPLDWSGPYIGYHTGGALGLADVADPNGPSIFGDTVRTPGPLVGGQLGYNWQRGASVLGVEADASWADMDGTNTCFAYSGDYVSANCRAGIDALGTVAARYGWILPFDRRTLLYGKAGLAFVQGDLKANPNGGLGLGATGGSIVDAGQRVRVWDGRRETQLQSTRMRP